MTRLLDDPATLQAASDDPTGFVGDRFVAGYVLYSGQQTLPYGHKLRALPIDALWRVAP